MDMGLQPRGPGVSSWATYRVHIQNRGLSAYDAMLQQARLLLVPQCLVLDPTGPSGALLSVDGCQIFVVEKSFKNDRCLMLP